MRNRRVDEVSVNCCSARFLAVELTVNSGGLRLLAGRNCRRYCVGVRGRPRLKISEPTGSAHRRFFGTRLSAR